MRQSTGEKLERLVSPRALCLEPALEFCADEYAEVTSSTLRLRKVPLDAKERTKQCTRPPAATSRLGSTPGSSRRTDDGNG